MALPVIGIILAIAAGVAGVAVGGYLLSDNKSKIIKTPRCVNKKYVDKLMLGFYGAASSGKSSAIKALFGIEPGFISPIPGTTKNVYTWPIQQQS